MLKKIAWIVLLAALLLLQLSGCQRAEVPAQPEKEAVQATNDASAQLLAHYDIDRQFGCIEKLASGEFAGRAAGTAGAAKAALYIEGQLQELGLTPFQAAGLSSFRHSFNVRGQRQPTDNIVAALPGRRSDRYLVVTAHYDHLGVKRGTLYPGADDNAVGVAALLELARSFVLSGLKPERTIVFAFLSGEEKNLSGSRVLAARLVREGCSDNCIVLNLDMLGGVAGDSVDIWAERTKRNPAPLIELARADILASGVKARQIRRRFAVVDSRSFARQGMPSITLSWDMAKENHPHRHRPSDTIANLRPKLVQQATNAVIRVAWSYANF